MLNVLTLLFLAQAGRITSGAYSVQPAASDVTAFHESMQVVSFRAMLKKPFEDFRRDQTPGTLPCSWEQTLEVVSLAGPYLGIRQDSYAYCKEAAHPAVDRALATYDLSQAGKALAITDLFPEVEVVNALAKDAVLAPYLGKKPASLAALLAALPEEGVTAGDTPCTFQLSTGAFALHHLESGRVAVRVSLIPMPGPCRGLHPELGILLPSPTSLRDPLVAAPAKTPKAKVAFEVR